MVRRLVVLCALVSTQANAESHFNTLRFPSAPAEAGVIGIERIIGQNDLEPIENAAGTPLYEMARSVARVEMSGGYCTGSRIGEELMLTNNHCLASCSSMVFRFGYERAMPREQHVTFRCTQIVATDSNLDYALIRVRVETGDATSVPVASVDRRPLTVGQPLFLAGHPSARLKEMDRSETCQVSRLATTGDRAIAHSCDTESGNSGSGVWDREAATIVALHWGYTDLNRATWMGYILDDVARRAPAALQELTIVE